MMKRLDIMIWKNLVEERGCFVPSTDMCCKLGMSRRQLLTRVSKLNFPYVEKSTEIYPQGGHSERETYFKLNCTPSVANECTVSLLSNYFGCGEDEVNAILNAVPEDRSVTLDEVQYPERFSMKDVIFTFSVAPCIQTTKTWTKNRYQRRDLNVPVDI